MLTYFEKFAVSNELIDRVIGLITHFTNYLVIYDFFNRSTYALNAIGCATTGEQLRKVVGIIESLTTFITIKEILH